MKVIRFLFLHQVQSGLFLVCKPTSKFIRQILQPIFHALVRILRLSHSKQICVAFTFSCSVFILRGQATQLYFFQLIGKKGFMSRGTRTSYEGFRRKNSLNSFDQGKSTNPSDLTFIRNRHREDLEMVENMSMELEKLSKRSLCSHSFCDQTTSHLGHHEEAFDFKFNSKTMHTTSLKNIELEEEEEGDKKDKVTSLAFFNKFDTIEQSKSICEEEYDEKPATTRDLPKSIQKGLEKRETLKQSLPNPSRKVANSQKNDLKKGRPDLKNDILELDKMKKELQSKKYGKESLSTKPMTLNHTAKRRDTVPINPKGIRQNQNQPIKSMNSQKTELIKSARNVPKPPLSTVGHHKIVEKQGEKLNEKEKESEYLQIESNQSKTKVQECPMAATRMLSDKEKSNLIARLMQMRGVIEKNQVCSDNLEEIVYHMGSIEQLLTR